MGEGDAARLTTVNDYRGQKEPRLSGLVGIAVGSCKVLLEDLGVTDGVEVRVGLCLLGSESFLYTS
jgi:hypothetical protein